MIKAGKLGHMVLNVSDLEASRDFYVKVVGLQVVAENAPRKIVFLSLGADHHDLALIQHATGPRPDATQPGLVHFAWRLENFAALQAAYKELTEAGIVTEPIQHNVTNSLYMNDPDGHLVELYCDRWSKDEGIEVMRTEGPRRVALNMETGVGFGPEQQLLPMRAS